jgi:large-conductance mechanosensitive channel
LIVGSPDGLTGKVWHVSIGGRSATFGWGSFLYAVINFIIIAAVIYFVFRWLHLDKLDKKKDKDE